MSFQSLSDVLRAIRERNQVLNRRIDESFAVAKWERAVGPLISKHTQVLRVVEGVLWIEVDHPIWKTELQHRKAQILAAINQSTESSLITDLFWVEKKPNPKRSTPL
jgi:predicted nucleic acid-binding Zn ribbon protein